MVSDNTIHAVCALFIIFLFSLKEISYLDFSFKVLCKNSLKLTYFFIWWKKQNSSTFKIKLITTRELSKIQKFKYSKIQLTARILANRNSKMRGVIPRSGLGRTSRLLISPSIVWVFPLPVYIARDVRNKQVPQKIRSYIKYMKQVFAIISNT